MLTSAEAMAQLGIKKTKFYKLIRTGELKVHNINPAPKRLVGERGPRRSIRIEQAEIDDFKARNCVTA